MTTPPQVPINEPYDVEVTERKANDAECVFDHATVAHAATWHGCDALFPLCDDHVQTELGELRRLSRLSKITVCAGCGEAVDPHKWRVHTI